ncbi:darcynin [Streptomyces olivaceus]|uniref:Darcynin n=1 Tax=Streptomyces olivaceus TaxID=47716 RepID=A0ABS7W6C2_STROV|nr:darcynin family protein [Streptomyces olivaceus]AOW87678.1 darcynin [Streptomyces olivaceus]MBZ6083513.1 darcynin [Streptomyces olivaceus]MBZ6091000.1 darcynin [Streptomyces olivaceus]MBZ6097175.1 darcynin [Streptomyces olivaceus]MBZ6121446.1 darcynin [Streptomyces olivaceus]
MSDFEPAVTAFLLLKTNRAWLELSVPERVAAFQENVLPAVKDKAQDVRWRYYDTEFYTARVTDIWVWEARSHEAFQLAIEALRETPFWDHYFEIVEILVGVENGYAKHYDSDILAANNA